MFTYQFSPERVQASDHLLATSVTHLCSYTGNSGLSWSDVLLGDMPNVYVYAANNPSESILAKRRGYGTIVSHNVPPYARSAPLFVHTHVMWLVLSSCSYCMHSPLFGTGVGGGGGCGEVCSLHK